MEKEEHENAVTLVGLFFLASFVYNILRTLKLTILLSEPGLDGQALSYLKIFAIMPSAMFFTWLTTFLQSKFGQSRTLPIMLGIFASVFAALTLFILPNKEFFQLGLQSTHQLVTLINYWYVSIFYIMAEMWSSIILNVLCWGLVLELTKLQESKRLYSLLSLSANIATFGAGWWANELIDGQVSYFFGPENLSWENKFLYQMIILWVCFAMMLSIFNRLIKFHRESGNTTINKKEKLGIIEAIKICLVHPIVRSVAIMMISFNIVYHLADVTHSVLVKSTFGIDPQLMNRYFNFVNEFLGIFAIIFSYLLSGSFIRTFGLRISLWVTPALWFVLSSTDFFTALFGIHALPFRFETVLLPLNLISLSLILSLGRAAKFTIFDTTKEMSFLSLSSQEKRLGKAAVDGLTSRLGKFGGAWLVIILVSSAGGSILHALFPLKICMMVAYVLWFYATYSLIKHLPKEMN